MKRLRKRPGRHQRRSPNVLRPALFLLLTVLVVRLLVYFGGNARVAALFDRAGESGGFVGAVMGFELGSPSRILLGAPLSQVALADQSSLLRADYGDILEAMDVGEGTGDVPFEGDGALTLHPSGVTEAPATAPPPTQTPFSLRDDIKQITISPSSPKGYDYADGVYIKNDTSRDIDVAAILKETPQIDFNRGAPLVLIIHTHASEAYQPDEQYTYVPTDTERTEDTNFNVVRIGDEMETLLRSRGVSVLHIRDIFDYPSYSGSYTRTLTKINEVLKEYPSIQIVLDIHRDAMTAEDGTIYRTTADINGKTAAQIMLVMGSDEGGLSHPEWRKNLRLALRVQKHANEKYPHLMRPVNLRKERFNEHATPNSMLVEMGTSGNTLTEALYSARLFSDVLADVINGLR
ncbi:stage II sporulation protein P [Oscillospiraceae bacterium OttesenSCG-928-G22]|nr:stage II sporulation protein P [Oscillospiraceae bacterium OttesenSCG-928-G22]